MSTPPSYIPVSIDYTSRDYYSIREQLISRIQDRIPTWGASDPADFGIALVEAFAYLGDLMSYYIDRNANEAFIATATQRESVLNLSQTYGYIPAGYQSANLTVTFTNTSDSTVVSLPAGTVVSGDIVIGDTVQTVYFTTQTDITSDPNGSDSGVTSVAAKEGRSVTLVSPDANSYGELVGSSDGTPGQVFQLLENPVVDGTVNVYVKSSPSHYSKWKQVQHIIDYGPYDQVFTSYQDANNNVYVQFGNGISGLIPTNFAEIRVQYQVGGGTIGNITPQKITTIEYIPGVSSNDLIAIQSFITPTNDGVGLDGAEPEPLDLVRALAPLYLRTNTRAVTLNDFKNLALGVSGSGKAQAVSSVWTSVTLYLAPYRPVGDPDLHPGLGDDEYTPTPAWIDLALRTDAAIAPNALIGTTVVVMPPTYKDVILALQYTALPQYTNNEVAANIKAKLVTDYSYYYMDFADSLTVQDVEYLLQQTEGVKTAKLTVMYLQGGSSGLGTVTAGNGQILRIQEGNISLGIIS
jgi:hypothetical protein